MQRLCLIIAVVFSFICGVAAQPAVNATTDKDALTEIVTRMARVGRCGSPSFSPDGKQLAFVCDLSGTPQVWSVSVEGGWPTMLTANDDPAIGVEWSPSGDLLAFGLAPGGGMNTQIYVMRPDGSGMRRVTQGGKDNNWLGPWTHDGRRLMMSSNIRTAAAMDSYLADPASGKAELVAKNEGIGSLEDVDHNNRFALLSRLRSRGDNNLFLIDLQNGKESLLTPHTPPGQFSGKLSPDGRTVYLATNKNRDLLAFGRISLEADGKPGAIEILAERSDAELDDFELNEQGTAAALVWNKAGRSELALYDVAGGTIANVPNLPAELIGGLTFSRDGKMLAMVLSGSTAPPDVWVLRLNDRALWQVTHSPHAGVHLAELVKPELVSFHAHDGLPLSGWLYRPKKQNAPGAYVISFHGGPEGQERPAFRADYQALLSQGIGVFAPNVRGSSGFGKRFVNLDNGALRVNGIRDIRSCVEYLVKSGAADPKRIGITGGSYGGYMTMVGVTEYPDLFAAGADLFGMVNFFTFFEHTEPWMAAISTIEYGDPKTQADLLKNLSPINKLDRITSPMIVLHGANDTNVPVMEAEQIVETLKKRNVPVEYVLFPDEGHGWRKVPNRIHSTVEVTRFFAKYLKAGESPSAAK